MIVKIFKGIIITILLFIFTASITILIFSYCDLKIGFDMQKNTCLGRVYLYRNIPVKDYKDVPRGLVALKLKTKIGSFKEGMIIVKHVIGKSFDRVVLDRKNILIKSNNGMIIRYHNGSPWYEGLDENIELRLKGDEIFIWAPSELSIDSRILGAIKFNDVEIFKDVWKII
ncbi:MAG: hypothetical protein ACI4V7_06320 [Succinivibrionaceae bacterium]